MAKDVTTLDFHIISKRLDSHRVRLEAVHTETGFIFHSQIFPVEVEDSIKEYLAIREYKKFVANKIKILLSIFIFEFFEIDYKGKSLLETHAALEIKIAELKEQGVLDDE